MNKPLLFQFNQWKIGTRLGVGFSMVLFLFILVSLLNWKGRNDNQRAFVLYSQASASSTTILELNHQISDLKSAILTYSQTGHKSGVARIKGLYANVEESLASKRLVFNDAERQRIVVRMNAVLSTYNENIDTLFADREQYDQYTRVILPQAANNVRATLERLSKFTENNNYPGLQLSIEQFKENFLSALVDANSFFAVRDHDLQQSAKASLTKAVKIWAKMQPPKNADGLQDLAKDLGVAINDYSTGFDNALQVTRGYLFLVNVVIPGEAAEFDNLSFNLKALTLKDLKEVFESTERNIKDNQKKISIITAIGILLGVLLAFLISKGIVRPLQKISTTFRQLVKREQVDNIPGLNRNDEIGQLAKAADVFRVISEKRFQSIFNEAPIGIALIDSLTGHILEVNPRFAEIAGRPLTEMTEIDWMSTTHPDDVQEDLDKMALLNAGEITGFQMEKRYIHQDGLVVWINMTVTKMDVPKNTSPCHFCMIENITDRKLAEEEERTLEQKLQHTQKLESLGVLSGGIAHDFNNILAAIIGYCGLTKLNFKTAEKNIPEIEKAAERAAGLCRQMMAYAGKAQLTKTKVNMVEKVEDIAGMLKLTLPQNAVIKTDLSAKIPLIECDASQLGQVVMNLIINASEAIGKEQGEVNVSFASIKVEPGKPYEDYHGKAIPPGEYVCLEVTDNGCGMDEEVKWRIFEPFYTTKFPGRGLGMSAALGIIKSHAGALQLFSQPGHGTTFKVYLPALTSEIDGDEVQTVSVTAAPWQGSGTILLAEDEAQVRYIAKEMLQMFGFTVLEAVNGKEALDTYLKNTLVITLVVTDMGMPVMDGYQLFSELKKLNSELPIIVSSGFGDTEVSKRIGRDNIAGIINKPYNMNQLQEVLKSAVEGMASTKASERFCQFA